MRRAVIGIGVACAIAPVLWLTRSDDDEEVRSRQVLETDPSKAEVAKSRTRRTAAKNTLSISGIVTDGSRGIPAALACARDVEHSTMTRGPICVACGTDGRFSLPLPAGEYSLSASAEGYVQPPSLRERASLRNDVERPEIELVMTRGGAALIGIVRDRSGTPIEGAQLSIRSGFMGRPLAIAESRSDGSFRAWVPEGNVAVFATADGYTLSTVEGRAPGTIDVTTIPESTLRGRVVRKDDRSPVAGVSVEVHASLVFGYETNSYQPSGVLAASITDTNGDFTIGGLPSGTYRPEVKSEGWYGKASRSVAVPAMRSVSGVLIEVATGALHVAGRIDGYEQWDCSDGTADLLDDYVSQHEGIVHPDGRFEITGVRPGKYNLWIECKRARIKDRRELVVEADVDDLMVELEKVGAVEGRTIDPEGSPAADVEVCASQGDVGSDCATSARAGEFELEIPTPGAWIICAGRERPAEIKVNVVDGRDNDPITLTIQKDDLSASIAGRVINERGAPLPRMLVRIEGARVISARTNDDGRFDSGPIPPGDYRVEPFDGFGDLARSDHRYGAGGIGGESHGDDARRSLLGGTDRRPRRRRARRPCQRCLRQALPRAKTASSVSRDPPRVHSATAPLHVHRSRRRLSLHGLSRATYSVRAEVIGHGAGVVHGVQPGDRVTIKLLEDASIEGRVVLPNGDVPDQFSIRAEGDDSSESESFEGTGGAFVLSGLEPGDHTIEASADEGSARLRVQLAPGEAIRDVVLSIVARGNIKGRVLDAKSKRGIGGVSVNVWNPYRYATTNDDGRFMIEAVPAGLATVSIDPYDRALAEYYVRGEASVIVVRAGETSELAPILLKKVPRKERGSFGFEVEWPPRGERLEDLELIVDRVYENSAANRAGLRIGDVIVAIDGVDVRPATGSGFWSAMNGTIGRTIGVTLGDGRKIRITAE